MKAKVLIIGVATLAAAPIVGMTAAHAASARSSSPHTVYVASNASSRAADRSCSSPSFTSINGAIAAVSDRDGTVIVCGGTFHEQVLVNKPVRIQGRSDATVDAKDLDNGFHVTTNGVAITGFTVKNATGEGIIVSNAKNATISHNTVMANDQGFADPNTDYPLCQPVNGTPNDCGENIHLMGATNAVVRDNIVTDGSGGILLSDETGPTAGNTIVDNTVGNNGTACGVVLAGHNKAAAPDGKPAPKVAGVFNNTVTGNNIFNNGRKSANGAGVQMATGVPGGAVYNNKVTKNIINENGHSGVTVHSHTLGQYLNGNVVTDNQIGENNINKDRAFATPDNDTTAVFVGAVAPLSITIKDNVMGPDVNGIFTSGSVKVTGVDENFFTSVEHPVSINK
jgi:parallel beta-helix repeat protein